jgi:GT2 family glycosyltransferase
MSNELFLRINQVLNDIRLKRKLGNYTVFQYAVSFLSIKGLKKIVRFIFKVIIYFFKKLVGVKIRSRYLYFRYKKKMFPSTTDLVAYRMTQAGFAYRPKISIIMPVFNPTPNYLKQAIESVLNQSYENWELCIADDHSSDPVIRNTILGFATIDDRIKTIFRETKGDICECSNSALELATGEFVGLLNHEDKLRLDALYLMVQHLQTNPYSDLIYSDEDNIGFKAYHLNPYFKPDWSPESFLSRNYISHLSMMRKKLVDQIGGFRLGYEGSQEYDLLLRLTEITENIHHIPSVLYHCRTHAGSKSKLLNTKKRADIAALKALEDSLSRRKIKGTVRMAIEKQPGMYAIDYEIFKPGKISIIIPTKNKHHLCEDLVNSIFQLTSWSDFEVLMIDNNSDEEEFFEWIKTCKIKYPDNFKCFRDEKPFNFSRLINLGAAMSSGDYILLLNNDTKVIHHDWLNRMMQYCQQPIIGAVGAKLLYKNNTIQHAGVIVGSGGAAGHPFVRGSRNSNGYFRSLKCVTNYSAVTAACLMVKRSHFNEVQGFDESLAVEFNDVDFCLKLATKGYRNIYHPEVELYHFESISRGHPYKDIKSYQQHLNDLGIFQKHWKKFIEHDPYYSPNLSLMTELFQIKTHFKDKSIHH